MRISKRAGSPWITRCTTSSSLRTSFVASTAISSRIIDGPPKHRVAAFKKVTRKPKYFSQPEAVTEPRHPTPYWRRKVHEGCEREDENISDCGNREHLWIAARHH